MLSVLTEYTRYTETNIWSLVSDLLHNLRSSNMLTLNNSLLWQPELRNYIIHKYSYFIVTCMEGYRETKST
jgi:hypothetical protein